MPSLRQRYSKHFMLALDTGIATPLKANAPGDLWLRARGQDFWRPCGI